MWPVRQAHGMTARRREIMAELADAAGHNDRPAKTLLKQWRQNDAQLDQAMMQCYGSAARAGQTVRNEMVGNKQPPLPCELKPSVRRSR